MSWFKKLLSMLLCLVLLLSCVPMVGAVQEQMPKPTDGVTKEPITIEFVEEGGSRPTKATTYYTSIASAADYLRSQMEKRVPQIVINYQNPISEGSGKEYITKLANDILAMALAHTGVDSQGDYLERERGAVSMSMSASSSGFNYNTKITYQTTYKTTDVQEAELTAAIDAFIAANISSGMTDHEKFRVIYDWMCANISYDYNMSSELCYTAYAAMIQRECVCAGYASLLYRMLLRCGIDNRIITGIGNGGYHAWNIVELDGKYYNADSTWDAGNTPQNYYYCLRSDVNFIDHIRDAEFTTAEFYTQYPMSDKDYSTRTLVDIAHARMILGNSLEFQFAVPKSACADWTGAYAKVLREGSGVNYLYTIYQTNWSTVSINGEPYWAISYDVLAAKEMADTFRVTIYDGNGDLLSNVHTDSVRDYVARAFSSQSAEGKTMMVDMLNYGAAAQKQFSYKTGDLANKNLTAAQKAYGTAAVPPTANTLVKGTNYAGTRLVLESHIQMQVAFKSLHTGMYAIYTYTDHNGVTKSYIVHGYDFINVGGMYGVELNALVYADARSPVTVKVYTGNGALVAEATDSIESYVNRSGNTELFAALMRFADSAKAYLHK